MISVFYYILARFQICRTWLNISEAQELDGATYETLKETYDHAMDSAKMAEHSKLQVIQVTVCVLAAILLFTSVG